MYFETGIFSIVRLLLQCASCPEHSVHQILEPSLEGLGACVAT